MVPRIVCGRKNFQKAFSARLNLLLGLPSSPLNVPTDVDALLATICSLFPLGPGPWSVPAEEFPRERASASCHRALLLLLSLSPFAS
eukprot:scaffold1_cov402-Prasinococcus_capsulatus_cf.AAC.73